jgi:hypothetical protein
MKMVHATTLDEVLTLRSENKRLRRLLKEARQYVDEAGFDEDPETTRNAGVLLREIDFAVTE